MIQEDCEAREAKQQRQAELAQFQLFQRFLATQAEVGRSTSNSSNDTWQDVIPPPSSMEGDSRNGLAMNQSASTPPARTRPATVTTHTNYDLCQELPNIIVHTIGNCPILSQHGLHCPAPSAIQPSPSLNTNIPPPSLPTIETSSILGSIRRQVATMEQTMNNGMENLADNVLQVTGLNNISFDAYTPSSPIPTGWKLGLPRLYRHKLHSLPLS